MVPALIAIATEIGAPIVRRILERQIGAGGADLAGNVIEAIARQAGVPADRLGELATTQPEVIREAVKAVEDMSPELIALYSEGLKGQFALMEADRADPIWMRAWRPGWMYLLGFFWFWDIVLLHVANAIWKIALPPVPFSDLVSLTGIFMGLYMGGHTVKDLAAKWVAR